MRRSFNMEQINSGEFMNATIATQYIVDAQGNKTSVVLTMECWQRLLEDLHDLQIIASRRDEQPINLQKFMQRLGISNDEL